MIKQLLKNNKVARRIKAIKDLLLEKLDALNLKSAQQNGLSSLLLKETHKTQNNTNLLLKEQRKISSNINIIVENGGFLLKFSVDMVKGLQHIIEEFPKVYQEFPKVYQEFEKVREETQQYHQSLLKKIIETQEENRIQNLSIKQTLDQVYTDIHNQKFKVVTDLPYFKDIEAELMSYLYSYLPHHRAIDIGANRGDVSSRLIQSGYEVYAFEPFPPVLEKLKDRLGDSPRFNLFSFAVGSANETRDLHIATDKTEDQIYDDSTFYSSLTQHSLSEGLVFTETLSVTVKTLASLHESTELPSDIGLVKIDTEGFDLEVIRGMGNFIYPVVVAKFWDANFPFGQSGAMNHLKDMVKAMRERDYRWHIVIYRIWGSYDISYYCNSPYSVDNSWGNVFFFQDYQVFSEALKWCSAVMPATYFFN